MRRQNASLEKIHFKAMRCVGAAIGILAVGGFLTIDKAVEAIIVTSGNFNCDSFVASPHHPACKVTLNVSYREI